MRDNAVNNFAARVTDTLDYACSAFAVVYINGEYYGILDMKENMNEDYVKRVYGVDDNDVVIVKSELDTTRGGRFDGDWFYYDSDNAEELAAWETICDKVASAWKKGSMTYYDTLAAQVDLHSFAEYCALYLFTSNHDWPHNNVKLWRYTGEPIEGIEITDGKWRFMTRDMDMTMGRYARTDLTAELDTRADVDVFYRTLGNYLDYSRYYANEGSTQRYEDALYLQGIFAFCMRNDDFRNRFAAYCRELISAENQALLDSVYDAMVAQVRSEIPAHITRWKGSMGNSSYTIIVSVGFVDNVLVSLNSYSDLGLDRE